MIIAYLMIQQPHRASFVALHRLLGIHQASVAHHLRMLESLGFVKLTRYRRPKRTVISLRWLGAVEGTIWAKGNAERPPP